MPDFIRPNYHVILIHYPLGLLGIGILIELFSLFFSRRSTFRTSGRWMILLGALLSVPAATSGMYAMWDVASHREDGSWMATVQKGYITDAQWTQLRLHTIYNLIGVGLVVFGVVAWLASGDRARKNLYIIYLLLILGGYGFFATAAWYAGEMVYAHQLSVETAPQPLDINSVTSGAGGGSIHPAFSETDGDDTPAAQKTADRYVNPLQLHVIFAGFVVSAALAALGLCVRGMTRTHVLVEETAAGETPVVTSSGVVETPGVTPVAIEPVPGETPAEHAEREALAGTPAVAPEAALVYYRVPAARFWMLTVLLAILTAAGGLYTAGNLLSWSRFQEYVLRQGDGDRDVAHAIMAGSIIVLALIMAVLAKWAPRSRFLLSGFAFLTLLVIAGQFWLGTLLLFDGSKGSLVQFRQSEEEPTTGPTLGQSLGNATHAIDNDLNKVGSEIKNAATNAAGDLHMGGQQPTAPTIPPAPNVPAPTIPPAPNVPAPTIPPAPTGPTLTVPNMTAPTTLPAIPAVPTPTTAP